MTYNEFMKMFKEFKRYKLIEKFNELQTRQEIQDRYNIARSVLSRVYNGKSFSISNRKCTEVLGYDIRNIEIENFTELRKKVLEKRINELKEELEKLSS